MAPFAPYIESQSQATFQPEQYDRPGIVNFIGGLPRYGFPRDISAMLTDGGEDRSGYIQGIVISSCCLLIIFILWSLALLFFKLYTTGWASGSIQRPPEPEGLTSNSGSSSKRRRRRANSDDEEGEDDDTSSTSNSSHLSSDNDNHHHHHRNSHNNNNNNHSINNHGHNDNRHSSDHDDDDDDDALSFTSAIFWEPPDKSEELTMAIIAREQKKDVTLAREKQRAGNNKKGKELFSTTTNGKIVLVTQRVSEEDRSSSSNEDVVDNGLYRVYIPPNLRLQLLRTYHDCLVHPDEVSNPNTMIYEFFTWNGIRRDAKRYVKRYRQSMGRGDNAALVRYDTGSTNGDGYDSEEEDNNDGSPTPITLDVIAREQKADPHLTQMMARAPSIFSTATNGSIQLITARGADTKYRIVIPTSLQAKVLRTYHDCLVNPTEENNFEKVLYVHFTWNGIHKDVDEYVANEGLTEEMRLRGKSHGNGGSGSGSVGTNGSKSRRSPKGREKSRRSNQSVGSEDDYSQSRSSSQGRRDGGRRRGKGERIDTGISIKSEDHYDNKSYATVEDDEEEFNGDTTDNISGSNNSKPIGLDEIAKEQKKDRELRQLKKEEPFVFSTVRYGKTLLTTAQNFRDNKYRIVIPRSLQGRMLLTYKECLLNPTPDRNFDTLLYNHFTWNGIHDDVDYFVKNHGRVPKKEDDTSETGEWIPLVKQMGKKSSSQQSKNMENDRSKRRRKDVLRCEDPEYVEWQLDNDRFDAKMKKIRISFLVCGLFMIISSILFFEMGVNRFFNSLDDAQVGLHHVEDVSNSVLSLTEQYLESQSGIQEQAKEIGTMDVLEWCSAASPTDGFTINMRNATYEIGIQLRDAAVRIETEVKNMESDIQTIQTSIHNADEKLDEFKSYMNIAKIIVILIDIIVILLMIACILAWLEKQHYVSILVRNACIIPAFVILLLLFWIFSTLALLGSMAGSDFCASPDETAVSVILRFQDKMSSVMFNYLMYYVTGCLPERFPPKIDTFSAALATIGEFVHDQLDNVNTAVQKFNLAGKCGGKSGPMMLLTLLDLSDTSIHIIYDALFGMKDLLQCRNFNPIYTTLVYDAVCVSGVGGLSWVFFTSLSMAVFSMIMITLRVAIYEY